MQFPESWLREFCDPPLTTTQLADLLTMSGMEVEECRPVAPPFSNVVVAEIVEAEPHPNADKLRVCRVDAGRHSKDGPLQIVCGAPNARVGIRVPLALVGAELPPGPDGRPFRIGVGKLRGVESLGMLCSARELQLSDDHGGLLELAADAPLGGDVRKVLGLDDHLFTLKLTPNLGHCLSVYGIAREVSALTGAPLKTPTIEPVVAQHQDTLPVRVEAKDLCGRFSGRIVRDVDPKAKTPAWMVERLARCGQRSVSALVDISNYVMFEYGRPSHIFDFDKIDGELVVRWARTGEALTLLNGTTVELDETVGVIADAGGAESLAGIMGGDHTAVGDDTRHVYVEAAFWWPEAVQGRARRFNFSTDAGHRFERGVDPVGTVEHIERITQLIVEICGGRAGPMSDQQVSMPQRRPVTLRVARAAKVVGLPLTQAQCADVMRRLGLPCTEGEGVVTVTPPSWRFDLTIEEDLIEEVIRVHGYDKLPSTPPRAPVTARVRPESQRSVHALRRVLADLDYQETINFSFVEERWERELAGNADPVRVLNPIATPLAVMRSSMMGGLLAVLRHNLARRAARVRVFEVGRVFLRNVAAGDGDIAVAGLDQPSRVGGLAYGPCDDTQWGLSERGVDFFDVKGDVEALLAPCALTFVAGTHPALHPGRSARIELGGHAIGWIGELHPRWCQGYELPLPPVLFELDLDAVLRRPLPTPQPLPRQQSVLRDLALVVADHVSHDALIAALLDDDSGIVRAARLFDLYKPKAAGGGIAGGERSMAVRLEIRDDAATLTDDRVDAVLAQLLGRLQERLGARLRA
ncbi:MAG TPA: phenylalanine--tRNA ligase subunit beta [Burkholderiaceae bacterium]|nr:phenylalanine--tRNA ligase subunit beta [Burkholderiaceae bacterium]